MLRLIIKILLPILILGAGSGGAYYLIINKKTVKSRPPQKEKIILVRTRIVEPKTHQVFIKSQGTTEASRELVISAEAGGKVVWVHPELVEGGLVTAGELLFRIDPVDYQLKVDQAKANLAKAEFDLDLVKAQKKAAEEEQKTLRSMKTSQFLPQINTTLDSLALFEPQLKNAQAGLEIVKINLKQAWVNYNRTKVYTPLSGYIRTVAITTGQSITANQQALVMFAASPILIKVSLPLDDLQWFVAEKDPKNITKRGSLVTVSKKIGNKLHHWRGTVKRQFQEIDNLGRLANILVEVKNTTSNYDYALPLGLYVDISIYGKTIDHVIGIPHNALHGGSLVWKLNNKSQLEFQKVSILRKNDQEYLLQDSLVAGDKIILSSISAPIPGMKLKEFRAEKKITITKNQSKE